MWEDARHGYAHCEVMPSAPIQFGLLPAADCHATGHLLCRVGIPIRSPAPLFLGGMLCPLAENGPFEPSAFFIAARNARKSKKARENHTCSGLRMRVFRVFTPRGSLSLGAESLAFERAGQQQASGTQVCWRASEINVAKRAAAESVGKERCRG